MPKDENAHKYNHLLNEANLLSSPESRKNNLTSEDAKKLSIGIDQNANTSSIQESLSKSEKYNKLLISDINIMQYEAKMKRCHTLCLSKNAATDLIQQTEGEGYKADCIYKAANFLTWIFFANDYMLENARKFNKVAVVDATYGTNNLKMPLICAYGVSNIGAFTLKFFPVTFTWTADGKEETYKWFLLSLQRLLNVVHGLTVFVTDKCKTLLKGLDSVCLQNKRLLCTWHLMNNLNDNCNLSVFKDKDDVAKFKDHVKNLMKMKRYEGSLILSNQFGCNTLYRLKMPSDLVEIATKN